MPPKDIQLGDKSPAARSGIQVIARAAKILRSLEDNADGLSLGDIAARVELPRSTVQRIVAALANEQFLIAASPTSRVKLGPALIRLAGATKLEVSQMVRPYIEALSRELKETIDLSILQGEGATFVDQVLGSHRLRTESAIGERFPLHCTACGKALLATLTDDKINAALTARLGSFTANTITSPEALQAQIKEIRSSEVAYDVEEYTEGVCAIGTVFYGPFGRAFAISVPVPTTRFEPNRDAFKEALLRCRDKITGALGEAITDRK